MLDTLGRESVEEGAVIPKSPRFSSPKYIRWIKDQPCVVCGLYVKADGDYFMVAHHVKGVGHFSGASLKAGDHLAMPMHATCHAAWHVNPYYQAQWEWLARTATKALEEIAEGRLKL